MRSLQVLGYYKSGADSESTVADNMKAFKRMRLLPKMLVDVSNLDTAVSIQGGPIDLFWGFLTCHLLMLG
jgi:(S)-2-hydroxy-acid oxidase